MFTDDFRQPVAIDNAPTGHLCEWCRKPAVYQLTELGGKHHNEEGFFCQACGEQFARTVADSLSRVITADTTVSLPNAHVIP